MKTIDIYSMFFELLVEIAEIDEDYHHEMRCVGRKQYPTEMRIWCCDGLAIWILPTEDGLNWTLYDVSGDRIQIITSSSGVQISGRGWKDRFINDIISSIYDFLHENVG